MPLAIYCLGKAFEAMLERQGDNQRVADEEVG